MENDARLQFGNPLISILLPFYNAENTLERAIESIVHQTFTSYECLLINNNSSDESQEIAERFCAKDKRFLLIPEKKTGYRSCA